MACSNPRFLGVYDWKHRPVPIPCGKCICCRTSRVSLMEQRAKYEYNNHASAAFVTFTYDDNHLPFERGFERPTLRRDHLHRFVDSVRHIIRNSRTVFPKSIDRNFSFVASGEYGDRFNRPHYHVIFFGLSPQLCKRIFSSSWRYGSIATLPLRQGGIRYVIKYLSKQEFGKHALAAYFDTGRESPFVMISKGFGSGYFVSQMKNIFKFGMLKFGQKFLPCPPYWKYKYFNFDKDNIVAIDERRMARERKIFNEVARPRGFKCYEDYMWRNVRNREENAYFKAVSRREQVFHDYSFPKFFDGVRAYDGVSVSSIVDKICEVVL